MAENCQNFTIRTVITGAVDVAFDENGNLNSCSRCYTKTHLILSRNMSNIK